MPVFEDDETFILGLNTTASWQPHLNWQEGVARRRDVLAARKLLAEAPLQKARIVATHHPLLPIEGFPRARPVRRALQAVSMLTEQKVDMLVCGHIHQTYAVPVEQPGGTVIAVGAPTALSTRMRGEPNGFWLIEVLPGCFRLALHRFDGSGFTTGYTPVQFNRRRL
jgi:3',5'-cyclic AMP phosphodiesterase CpdA